MAIAKHSTIVGVFENHGQAQKAVSELKRRGFTESQIGVAGRNYEADDATRKLADPDGTDHSYATQGATAGLATGAGVGALWGLGILAGVLPAIGPAIAGGTLMAMLSSAAAGAATAGLAGGLIGMGMSKDEADYYETEYQTGRTIVTVDARERQSEARQLFDALGGYDIAKRKNGEGMSSSLTQEERLSEPSLRDDLTGTDWAELHEASSENTAPRRTL
jgi:hypothetical protein